MDNEQNNRRIDNFNEILDVVIAGQRPPLEQLSSEEEFKMLRVAIALRSAADPTQQPDSAFVSGLHKQIMTSASLRHSNIFRRNILVSSVASLLVGIVGGLGLSRYLAPAPTPVATATPKAPPELSVTVPEGSWMRVAAQSDVRPGEALPFTAGSIDGFLLIENNKIVAISAICTHLACRLRWNMDKQDLVCPCHGVEFDITGKVVSERGPANVPPLPRPKVEIRDDGVYVYTVA